jgi:hypothetical protein
MNARWLTGLTIAAVLACAGAPRAAAQQGAAFPTLGARAGTFANTPTPGVTFFPSIARPLGFNAAGVQPFFPDIRAPQSGMFLPATSVPFGVAPFGTGAAIPNGLTPTVLADPRVSLSQGFNPFLANPSLSRGFNPALTSPTIPDVRASLSGTSLAPVVLPSGVPSVSSAFGQVTVPSTFSNVGVGGGAVATPIVVLDENGVAFPAAVAIPFPSVAAPQRGVVAAGGGVGGRSAPGSLPRRTVRRAAARDARSVREAERLMAQVPLTEGKVVDTDARGVRVRVTSRRGSQVRRYPADQVFFFTRRGEMLRAADQGRLARGTSVLVPATRVTTS